MATSKEFTPKELLILEAFDRIASRQAGTTEPTTRMLSDETLAISVNGASQILTHLQQKKAVEYVSGKDGDKKWKKPSPPSPASSETPAVSIPE